MKKGMLAAVGAALVTAAALPSAAHATTPVCQLSDFAGATACSGWYAGNLLKGTSSAISAQQAALASIGFTWNGDWNVVDATKVNPTSGNNYNFATLLNGTTWIGIHKGKARGGGDYAAGFEGTAFYKLDANNLDFIIFQLKGGSSAVVYQTGDTPGVPEPQTWVLMMLGFAAAGYAMRRKTAAKAQFAAA